MYRALIHYWRANLAVSAAAAMATAVLCGALMVGDSVRTSLRNLALERLGGIDFALAGQRFFREELHRELGRALEEGDTASMIALDGSVRHGNSRARASSVGIQGIDQDFLDLYASGVDVIDQNSLFARTGIALFPPAAVNSALATALGAKIGDDILVSLQRWSEVPSGSVLGRKETAEVVETVRLSVTAIIPDEGLGAFSLRPHQSTAYNVFVPLAELQRELDQESLTNAIVARGIGNAEDLDLRLRRDLQPADIGLSIRKQGQTWVVESDEFILRPGLGADILDIADQLGSTALSVFTYLATSLTIGDSEIPYSTVAAIELARSTDVFGELWGMDGAPIAELADDEILINSWTAERLGAKVGDPLELRYFVVEEDEKLRETTTTLRVGGVTEMSGLGADPTLSQEYPGIAGNDDMSTWDPPFPIDLGRITQEDEDYWDDYRGTPKAFLALTTGQKLWRNRWGNMTSIRLAGLDGDSDALWSEIAASIELSEFGYSFRSVKTESLSASRGATDFGGLFIGFSQFLIVSAALLVGLLFGLAVEQRSREVGLRLALGFPPRQVRKQLLLEGGLIGAVGTLIGLAGAVGYAALMMKALGTWWRPAVGTSRLELSVTPFSLVVGGSISLLVVFFAIWRTLRKFLRRSPRQLLAGSVPGTSTLQSKRPQRVATAGLGLASVALVFAIFTGRTADPLLFYIIGPSSLIGLLAAFAVLTRRKQPRPTSLLGLARANGARNQGRSLLAVSLVACASFLVVVVAAYREDFDGKDLGKNSGTGGFALLAESDIPIVQDVGGEDAGRRLGLSSDAVEALESVEVIALRLLPGEDTSCLNLYQPTKPRLLAVPQSLIERNGFVFKAMLEEVENPWTLLDRELGLGVVPVIGDFNSTQWILKLPLGGELPMATESGEDIRLRLVASLDTSIFQSELLISQRNFERYYPSRSGSQVFLFDTSRSRPSASLEQPTLGEALEADLEPYGLDVIESAAKLARFHSVQNTYLSTFRVLGGLGLLLGTIGLAIVLVRNTLERRGELAAFRAFGFRRRTLLRLVVYEYAILLGTGLGIGTVAALLTVGAHVLHHFESVPWASIGGTLGSILVVGLIAGAIAASAVLRAQLVAALKADL